MLHKIICPGLKSDNLFMSWHSKRRTIRDGRWSAHGQSGVTIDKKTGNKSSI